MILMVAKEDGAVYTADVTSWLIPRGRGAPSRLLCCCGQRGRQLISIWVLATGKIVTVVIDDNSVGLLIIFLH